MNIQQQAMASIKQQLIHVTFFDGSTALFRKYETITCCAWLSDDGKYFDSPIEGQAVDVLESGRYVLQRAGDCWIGGDLDGVTTLSVCKIKSIRFVDESPAFLLPQPSERIPAHAATQHAG